MIFSIDQKPENAPALCAEDGTVVTYGKLSGQIGQVADAVPKRVLIFCMCRNTPESVIGYLAFVSGKAVPLLLDAGLSADALKRLRTVYRPPYFWLPKEMLSAVPDAEPVLEQRNYVLAKTGDPVCPLASELALLLPTSGSTGSPKLVRLSRKNLEANAESISCYLRLTAAERPITTLPMQYSYGLSILNSHLLRGACILLTQFSVVQQQFWNFLREQRATSFGGVPFTYELLRRLHFTDHVFPSLHSMTQAGGKLPVALQREFGVWARKNGVRFYVMYGQTEATARMSYLAPEKCLEKCGSVGMAIPGGRFSLRGGDGSTVEEPEQIGELLYEGDNVTLGYAECAADLAKGDERKGVLETGDMARRDSEGYYYIAGRKKRFVKMQGIRVSLDECEQLLLNRFRDFSFACVGRDDRITVFTTDAHSSGAAADYLASALRLHPSVVRERFLPEIPKNDAGKTLYAVLRKEAEEV
mgnify:CR=1 FL=1